VSNRLDPGDSPRPLVVPVRLCRNGDPLHRALRGYKDAPAVAARNHFTATVGSLLADFVGLHAPCIERTSGSSWDSVAVVPSSVRPDGSRLVRGLCRAHSPLEAVVRTVIAGAESEPIILERGDGVTRHLAPHPHAYTVVGDVRGRRVLLVDDVWVTGARIRSAAATLERGGASVAAMLVVGRIVDTGAAPGNARWWSWAESKASPGRDAALVPCCLSQCTLATTR